MDNLYIFRNLDVQIVQLGHLYFSMYSILSSQLCISVDRDGATLKDHLMEDLDYSLVPEEVWKKFVAWYGLEESSKAIPRKVVEHGLYVKHCKVEVYLVEFKLALHPDVNAYQTKKFSRADTVGERNLYCLKGIDVTNEP